MDAEIAGAQLQANVCSFVDDILIHSASMKEHIRHVEAALQMLEKCNLKAHPDKIVLAAATVEFLGHNVSAHGLLPNEAKILAIKALPEPTCVSELRSVLGLLNYYRCYVPNFSTIAHPLNNLLKDATPWEWGTAQQNAFDKLKDEICTEGKALKHFDPKRPTILHTDWSKLGIGAVLGQIDDDGKEYMVACISRSLNAHERNYISFQGEMLAAVWAVKTFHAYLHGVPFCLITDHQPLTWLMTKPDLVHQHARWAITLQQYQFTIEHRPGITHQNADTLSRFPHCSNHDCTEARLDPSPMAALTLHIKSCASHAINVQLCALTALESKAPFSESIAPADHNFMSDPADTPLPEHTVHAFASVLQQPGSTTCGGCVPCSPTSALALTCVQTCLPTTLSVSLMSSMQEATEQYYHQGPHDVWLDAPVMQ